MKISITALWTVVFVAFSGPASATQADDTSIAIIGQTPGPKPFIKKLSLLVSDVAAIDRIQFGISPKQGSVTRPLSATYAKTYLAGRGYVDAAAGQITVPIFGLYAGATNKVVLTYFFKDGSSRTANTSVVTPAYGDPCGFNNHAVLQARTSSTRLSYDYVLMTSNCSQDSPAVIDTDGEIRWVGTAGIRNYVSTFYDNAVYLAHHGLLRIELDGAVTRVADFESVNAIGLHHSIDPGKHGIVIDVDTKQWVESVNIEVDPAGNVLKRWELGEIIRNAMIAGGDDPTEFVRNAKGRYDFLAHEDWFHNNSTAYRKADDSLIVSSRENFVICLDYETGAIKWILGDPTKQWYQYPSLRKYALALSPGTRPPIGQHTVSITKDDHLLLFDNGQRSQNHIPLGASRGYSAPRKYALDLKNMVAKEVWSYSNNESVRAPFRSGVYEDAPLNYVVHYDVGQQRVLGIDATGERVFDYRYPGAGFRSLPVHWENLTFPATAVRLANISARSQVDTGDDVTVTGFIVSGNGPKTVVLRGLGPSLQVDGAPVPGRLMDPVLELHDSNDQTVQVNDNYKSGSDAAAITKAGLAPQNDNEAAIFAQLAPGAYTAVLRGSGNTTGIGLSEVFDISADAPAQLGNLSARAFTSSGDRVLIGGLILQGSKEKRVLFRAAGPTLQAKGIANALQNPTLDIYDADGVKIATNDDWQEASNSAEVQRTGIAPTDSREPAILMPLGAGNYTFIATGKDGAEGVATVEAYRLD
ncbi:MAG: aryl-sulfate sulfotransferase [Chthoniobacterales bacterium]|nr:aryl-sulfate sulfotransferase [Chthoniobacterales bacterium]